MNEREPFEAQIWEMVEHIIGGSSRVSFVTTGGGSRAASWLLNHPGASAAMLEAQVPYHPVALERFLGTPGPHGVVAETARSMALVAFRRASTLLAASDPGARSDSSALGLACTAALATARERKGGDRAYVALRAPSHYQLVTIEFKGGARDRLAQEDVMSAIIVQTLATGAGSRTEAGLDLPSWVQVRSDTLPVEASLEGFLLQPDTQALEIDLEGRPIQKSMTGRLLLCGSFNPLHDGHRKLAAAAGQITGLQPQLELSITNVDKAQLGYHELARRVVPLRGEFHIAITRAATFQEKSRLFPGACFVIGYDTASRLLAPKYYGGSADVMHQALQEIAASGCRFLVAGRQHLGAFRTLEDLVIPATMDSGFLEAIDESEFRNDTSSTQIRTTDGVVGS